MQWDALAVRRRARDLDSRLRGSRVRALHLDGPRHTAVLFLREATLVLDLTPGDPGMTLGPPQDPPPLARALAATVSEVRSVPDERVMEFVLRKVRGKGESQTLVVEWMGPRANLALVGRQSGRMSAVLHRREGGRPFGPGLPYPPLPPSGREGVNGELSREAWIRLASPEEGGEPDRRSLLRNVAWTSGINAPAILEAGAGGWAVWKALVDGSRVVEDPGSGADEDPGRDSDGGAPQGVEEGPAYLPPEVVEHLQARRDQAARALKRLESELRRAPDPEEVRRKGDLLLAQVHAVPRGAASVVLDDFQGGTVELRLDPSRTPAENAEALYAEASRAGRAREGLPDRIREAGDRLRQAEAALERAWAGELDPETVDRILKRAEARAGGSGEAPLPYRTFRSTGGLEIRVGRGAGSNDALTFHHARPMDVWLHARSVGGAHVILRWDREERPPRQDLEEAAILAALHSKARTAGTAPVDWTRRKWVRKPRKARPGAVTLQREETLFVRPDPDLLDRLRDEGDGVDPGP